MLVLQLNRWPFRKTADHLFALTTHAATFCLLLVAMQSSIGYHAPVAITLGLTLLPLWAFALATAVLIPGAALLDALRRKAPKLAARIDAMPDRAATGVRRTTHRLSSFASAQQLSVSMQVSSVRQRLRACSRRLSTPPAPSVGASMPHIASTSSRDAQAELPVERL